MSRLRKFTDTEKWCPGCRAWLPLDNFYDCPGEPSGKRSRCIPCFGKQNAKHARKYKYGISDDDLKSLWERQGGKCAICLAAIPVRGGRNGSHIDHDHKTGAVRGLLCHNCNRGLGGFRDTVEFLQKAIAYIQSTKI